MEVTKLFVVGAGTMGAGIAQAAIQAGIPATLCDVSDVQLAQAKTGISKALTGRVAAGKMSEDACNKCMTLLQTTASLQDAASAELVIEAAVESLEVKRQVFAALDQVCRPNVIFASNTSTISITAIASAASNPGRFAGTHFFNPVPAMKLLEIVQGLNTSLETIASLQAFGERLGKIPIVAKDSGGFIVNRIFSPMLNAAVNALDAGLGSREDIDNGLKFGCGHPMGPLALIDMVGLDVQLAVMEVLYAEFGAEYYKPAPLLGRMVAAGYLGRKNGKGFYDY